VDADLAAANIKAGTVVFGVNGSAIEATGDATVAQVLSGATFSKAGAAGLTGTMANQGARGFMPGVANVTIPAGYYSGTGVVTGDADLVTGNIKAGTTIFGVAGKTEVVDTTSGDAAAGDLLVGKKAWVDGAEVTGTAYPASVPKTGQTTSYRTGDDGDLEKGVAWPNPRFTVTTNGSDVVVTDNMTGLMWVKAPHSLSGNSGGQAWNDAIDFCNGLTFAGQSDWRLPNVREIQSLIDHGCSSPALPAGYPFTGVQSDLYWSSSTYVDGADYAWYVDFYVGDVLRRYKVDNSYVWPVRAGQ
jgi:hypothetical protein